jgi:RNA polymerase sigma-70 factor (ECF subfamily)
LTPENEILLLSKIKQDDEVAHKVIFRKYYPRLYYFVLEFVSLSDIAENIVQDTFFTLWNNRKNLADNTNLSAYLFTVAKKTCLYKLRGQKYRQKIISQHDINDELLTINLKSLDLFDTSDFVFYEIQEIIDKTLEDLPPKCKTVFVLSRFEEKKNREIAEELGISVKAVEGHISKALKKFRVELKDYLPLVIYLFIP